MREPRGRRTGRRGSPSQTTWRTLPRVEAVGEIVRREQRRGRDEHRAELDRRQHRLPERRHVAEHQQHAVATPDAEPAQTVREPVGRLRQLAEREPCLAARPRHDVQRRPVARRHRSNQSSAQLNSVSAGQANSRWARASSPRHANRRSRAALNASASLMAASVGDAGPAASWHGACARTTPRAVQLHATFRALARARRALARDVEHLHWMNRAAQLMRRAVTPRRALGRVTPCNCTGRSVQLSGSHGWPRPPAARS